MQTTVSTVEPLLAHTVRWTAQIMGYEEYGLSMSLTLHGNFKVRTSVLGHASMRDSESRTRRTVLLFVAPMFPTALAT